MKAGIARFGSVTRQALGLKSGDRYECQLIDPGFFSAFATARLLQPLNRG